VRTPRPGGESLAAVRAATIFFFLELSQHDFSSLTAAEKMNRWRIPIFFFVCNKSCKLGHKVFALKFNNFGAFVL